MKYKNHQNAFTIQAKYKGKNKFSFTEVTKQDIEKGKIFDLENKKLLKFLMYQQRLLKKGLMYLLILYPLVLIVPLNLLCFRLVLNLQM